MSAIVSFRGVCKAFGPLNVLDDLDVDIAAGEKVAIIGPCGSGKTTLLRILMTLERIDGGEIWVDGEAALPRGAERPRRAGRPGPSARDPRQIGMVFQQFNLFPHMSALDNVPTRRVAVLGLSRAEARERARELLDAGGAAGQGGRISGAPLGRPAAAGRDRPRLGACSRKIMLFDEITSALDPELSARC